VSWFRTSSASAGVMKTATVTSSLDTLQLIKTSVTP
jgi:hypothetical protein